jgi:hypothetical protein
MNAEIQHLAWIAGKAVLLYATAIIGLRLGKRRILAELSPFDFVAAVAVGAIVGRIPSASDADYLAGAVTLISVLFAHALVSHLRHFSSGRVSSTKAREYSSPTEKYCRTVFGNPGYPERMWRAYCANMECITLPKSNI